MELREGDEMATIHLDIIVKVQTIWLVFLVCEVKIMYMLYVLLTSRVHHIYQKKPLRAHHA